MSIKREDIVFTLDGKQIGTISRIVVEARSHTPTHFVVQAGTHFPEDRIVPLDLVAFKRDNLVVLKQKLADLDDLSTYDSDHFVPTHYGNDTVQPAHYLHPLIYYPPSGSRNQDDSGIANLHTDAKVFSKDEQFVGIIESILISDDSSCIEKLVIRGPGVDNTQYTISIAVVETINQDQVHLSVAEYELIAS